MARKLAADLSPDMTVAVDDLAGTVHLTYGGLPFCAAIVRRDGVLVHREEWASAAQLRAVIANLTQADRRLAAGEQARLSLSETLWSMEHLPKNPSRRLRPPARLGGFPSTAWGRRARSRLRPISG